jgi:tRNA threonylcarbamoyladenosine biosynthesis protein TsaB
MREVLHPFITVILKEANITMNQIDAVAVESGPGSYTGFELGFLPQRTDC